MERLSWVEICRRYPQEWIVLIDYTVDDNEDVQTGIVFAHAREKSEIRQEMAQPRDAAILYTGPVRSWLAPRVHIEDETL